MSLCPEVGSLNVKHMGQFQEIHWKKLVELGEQLHLLDTPSQLSLPFHFSLVSLGWPCNLRKKSWIGWLATVASRANPKAFSKCDSLQEAFTLGACDMAVSQDKQTVKLGLRKKELPMSICLMIHLSVPIHRLRPHSS